MREQVHVVPEVVADYSCHIGENPAWHPLEKRVYWCDISNGRIFRYEPSCGVHEKCYDGEVVGGFTIQDDGSLLLFMARGAIKRWHGGKVTTLLDEIRGEEDSRFNDVIADPIGRVFCGTMPTPERLGRLYRLDPDRSLTTVIEGIGCSNGMAFSLDHTKMYYTDSVARTIYLLDYDEKSGNLRNQRVFVKTQEPDGVPDGATMDDQGFLWSAQWGGSCLIRYGPDGNEERRVMFPVKKVSSLTFGGEAYAHLYVTTAGGDDKFHNGKYSGALFRLSVGIKGRPDFCSRIRG